jgi:hypothetical protein
MKRIMDAGFVRMDVAIDCIRHQPDKLGQHIKNADQASKDINE